jgi:hypothetical protein
MGLTRRQGLLAIVATLGGIVLNGLLLGRLRSVTRLIPNASVTDRDAGHRRRGSRGYRIEPDPHSVKRHA